MRSRLEDSPYRPSALGTSSIHHPPGGRMPRSRRNSHCTTRRSTLPRELRTVNLNAAGVDVGAERHYVAVPEGRDPEGHSVRSFGAFTADLHALAAWLRVC